MAPKILVILLNWNGKNDTIACLDSLAKISSPVFTPLIIDNGSTDDSVQTFQTKFPQVHILQTGENLGFAAGNNAGISWGLKEGYEWILLLNNDTVVDPDVLNAFLRASREKPQAKIFGGKIYRFDEPTKIDHLGALWNLQRGEFTSPAQHQIDDGRSFETMQKVDSVCGACLFMHRSVPETIGLLEERFFLLWEETDFCWRARQAHFEVWTAPQAKIWHKISASFVGGKPHMHYFWWRGRLLFIERNLSPKERTELYGSVIGPELRKLKRHYLIKSFLRIFHPKDEKKKRKILSLKAGLTGARHFFMGRFGNCPEWLICKKI